MNTQKLSRFGRTIARTGSTILTTMLILTVLAATLIIGATVYIRVNGQQVATVLSGSMTPTFRPTDAIIISRRAPVNELRVGQIVTFKAPGTNLNLTTHRIVAFHTIQGREYIQTKGDANQTPDINYSPVTNIVGVVTAVIPHGGIILAAYTNHLYRLYALGGPLLVLFTQQLLSLAREIRTRKTSPHTPASPAPHIREAQVTLGPDPRLSHLLQQHHTLSARYPHLIAILLLASLTGTPGAPPNHPTNALFSDTATITNNTVSTATLAPPTNLTATGTQTVTLNWVASTSTFTTGYTIGRSTTAGGPYTTIGTVTAPTTTYTDAPPAGTYYYTVQATSHQWTSARSNEATATTATTPSTTTPQPCTTQIADTGGDNNGYETNPQNACGPTDNLFASDLKTGTNTTINCTNPGKDRHRFATFNLPVPGSATSITGITINVRGKQTGPGNGTLCVQLSGNNGATWTSPTTHTNTYTAANTTQTLTFGSPTDTWGAPWTPANLNNTNFSVRIIDMGTKPTTNLLIDSITTTVTYTP